MTVASGRPFQPKRAGQSGGCEDGNPTPGHSISLVA